MEKEQIQKKKKTILSILKMTVTCIGALTLIGMITYSCICGYIYMQDRKDICPGYEVYHDTTMLKYFETKSKLVDEVHGYILNVAQFSSLNGIKVVNKCIEHDVDICFVLAQGELESHFGTTGTARHTNSVWNVKAYDGLTHQEIGEDGKFKNPDESVDGYLTLIKEQYMYDGKTEYDLLEKYVNKSGKRYASSNTYEEALMAKYVYIRDNTKIDSLSKELKRYSIRLGGYR